MTIFLEGEERNMPSHRLCRRITKQPIAALVPTRDKSVQVGHNHRIVDLVENNRLPPERLLGSLPLGDVDGGNQCGWLIVNFDEAGCHVAPALAAVFGEILDL